MPSRLPTATVLALLAFLFVASACGSGNDASDDGAVQRTTYTDVRGRFLGTASDGRDIVVHHEAIPNLMDPMIMSLPIGDTTELRDIEKDAAIEFDLVIEGSTPRVDNVVALPDTVTLDLSSAADSSDA